MAEFSLTQSAPDYLKEVQDDDLTKNLGGGSGGGLKRISIRGSVFRLMVGGEEVAKNENRSMNIVVTNGAPKLHRQYYSGPYVAGESIAPDCWSSDSSKPDEAVENPQSTNCATCPQNVQGSGMGNSRACRFQQRLAVVLADDIDGDIYQLTLPATSIFGTSKDMNRMPFQQYAKFLNSQGKSIGTLVTEMKFDSDSDTPKLIFKPVRFLEKDEWVKATEKGKTPLATQAITLSINTKKDPEPMKLEEPSEPAEPKKKTTKKATHNSDGTPKTQSKDLESVMSAWTETDD